jgi:stearoyl-CoA desaturase (delta-9 desaturase)
MMSASGFAQQPRKPIKPSITVRDPKIRAVQRRMAVMTMLIPAAGTVTALVLAAIYGVSVSDLAMLAGMFVLTTAGIEVGFHRCFAHKAFETSRGMKLVLAALGSMAAEGSLLYWAAGHRRHHTHSDTGDDPHSPHVRKRESADERLGVKRGLWHAHIQWMMTDNVTNCTLFAKDILRDPLLNKMHAWYLPLVLTGLAIPAAFEGVLTGTWRGALNGFLWGGLVRMFLVHHSSWSNASFSHVYGTRPFATGDHSANNLWCALPTFGASWQNNHHMFPSSAYLGLEWWQVDVGAWFVRIFSACRLIWNVNAPPSTEMIAAHRHV